MPLVPVEITRAVTAAHQAGQTVVLATGVFDILHAEHRRFLEKAAASGDLLVVGIESDVRVKVMKGEGRPINLQSQRLQNLLTWQITPQIFILPESFDRAEVRMELLKVIRPQILAVSSHSAHLEAKRAMMAEVGGVVKVVHEHNPAVSTTLLLAQQHSTFR